MSSGLEWSCFFNAEISSQFFVFLFIIHFNFMVNTVHNMLCILLDGPSTSYVKDEYLPFRPLGNSWEGASVFKWRALNFCLQTFNVKVKSRLFNLHVSISCVHALFVSHLGVPLLWILLPFDHENIHFSPVDRNCDHSCWDLNLTRQKSIETSSFELLTS
jgi:hypothetical protein